MHLFKDNFNPTIVSFVIETFLNRRFDHELFGLRPSHPLFHEHPTVNDQIATKILSGTVKVKGEIHSFTKNGVLFKENQSNDNTTEFTPNQLTSKVTPIDSIIFATGYHLDYPFLSPALKSSIFSNENVNLYKYVFPILDDELDEDDEVSNVNFAFIGVPNALGPLFPIAEIQSRWIVQVIKGTAKLPSKSTMRKHLDIQKELRER